MLVVSLVLCHPSRSCEGDTGDSRTHITWQWLYQAGEGKGQSFAWRERGQFPKKILSRPELGLMKGTSSMN